MGLRVPALAALVLLGVRCSRPSLTTTTAGDAVAPQLLQVRVPAALTMARALDTLSVAIDPASLALTQVTVDPGMTLGVESDVVVFPQGQTPPPNPRHGLSSGADFDRWADTWSTAQDGLPVPGVKYVADVRLVLFATDVPPGHMWDPHAGRYEVLWTRTLQQAEE